MAAQNDTNDRIAALEARIQSNVTLSRFRKFGGTYAYMVEAACTKFAGRGMSVEAAIEDLLRKMGLEP